MKITENIQRDLRCPLTHSKLQINNNFFESISDTNIRYPIIDGIPILINNKTSIFSIENFVNRESTTFNLQEKTILKIIKEFLPAIGVNLKAEKNYNEISAILPDQAKILVIGGSIKGIGIDCLYNRESFDIIATDVTVGPETQLICDAHDIPFEDQTFDCVVIQAVLEHVLDPQRCVSEMHRVLNSSGIVYAETPFMQQVHMKEYDFTRFTHLGHLRLFRSFDELHSGPVGGPGMALAWSYKYFLKSFSSTPIISKILGAFASFTSFHLKYFDHMLIDKPGSYDAASGFYFLGRKSKTTRTDKDLIKQFKGQK